MVDQTSEFCLDRGSKYRCHVLEDFYPLTWLTSTRLLFCFLVRHGRAKRPTMFAQYPFLSFSRFIGVFYGKSISLGSSLIRRFSCPFWVHYLDSCMALSPASASNLAVGRPCPLAGFGLVIACRTRIVQLEKWKSPSVHERAPLLLFQSIFRCAVASL